MNVVCYERLCYDYEQLCYERGLFQYSVMNRSVSNGHREKQHKNRTVENWKKGLFSD